MDWVLVVDDDVTNLKMAGHILSKQNMRVTALRSGTALLDYVKTNKPDLILLDLMMPGMDGFETFEKLKLQMQPGEEIPVIFLTADENQASETRGLQLGAMDFIKKPFVLEVLTLRVSNTIQLVRLRRDLSAEVKRKTQDTAFDVIFMDHFMPNMDGIECLHEIRNQSGGLSREAKVIALTANTGSDLKAMYAREGFDGYLVKPVSGKDLERELQYALPRELVHIADKDDRIAEESIAWISDHQKKQAVAVTTESVADLPDAVLQKYGIGVIPHMISTKDGGFGAAFERTGSAGARGGASGRGREERRGDPGSA